MESCWLDWASIILFIELLQSMPHFSMRAGNPLDYQSILLLANIATLDLQSNYV